jgi:hypothetical protein
MHTMFNRFSTFIALALFAVAATLAVSPRAGASTPVSPFAGSWHGPFTTDLPNGAFGYVTFNIADNGKVTGAANYYIPDGGSVSGGINGHVNENGFGAFIFHSPPQVIPYLLFLSINADGELEVIAPTPWDGGFTVFATLHQ